MKMLKLNLKHFTWYSFKIIIHSYSLFLFDQIFWVLTLKPLYFPWYPRSLLISSHFHKYFTASRGNDLLTWLTLL